MTFKYSLLILLLTYSTGIQAQEREKPYKGFYGKKFTMQLGGGLHHNSLLKLLVVMNVISGKTNATTGTAKKTGPINSTTAYMRM